MTDAYVNVGLLVMFFALFYWLFRKPQGDDPAKPDYLTSQRDLGYSGKYCRKHKLAYNTNSLINTLFGAPAIITQDKKLPDVSFYQGAIDWDIMRQKADAVIIRAGQNLWVDAQFERNWREAKRVGMRRGVYWFYDDRVSPGKQAAILIDLIRNDLPEMEVFIDWENSYGGGFAGLSQVCAMMQAVEKALPIATVGIYTGYYWWREHTNPITNILQYNYLKYNPLWLAWYADASLVQIPQPWAKLTHWQFGTPAVGEEWGVQTRELDMNYFNGTETDFALRYGGLLPDEPPPPTGEIMDRFRVTWTDGCNRRVAPNVNNTPIPPFIAKDAEFDVSGYSTPPGKTEAQELWGLLTDTYWVAIVYNGQVRAVRVQVTEPAGEPVFPQRLIAEYADGTRKVYVPE